MAHYLNLIAVVLVPAVIGTAGLLLGTAWYELTYQRRQIAKATRGAERNFSFNRP